MSRDQSPQKADFGAIYDQPDPRAYFLTLEPFDYAIPQHGADLFSRLLGARQSERRDQHRVLDVCCSYGVVATLLKTDLDLAAVYAHYRQAEAGSLTSGELVELDRRLLQERHRLRAPTVVGLDVAPHAVAYALATGALDAGFTENLEDDAPSAALIDQICGVDLITATGGVGYVTEKTFGQLVAAAPATVWVAAFCLRSYDYTPISDVLSKRGLRTERLPETFPQRRFTGPEEQQWAISQVRARGLDPSGLEDDGHHHAEFYLSRPAAEVAELPLPQLLGGAV